MVATGERFLGIDLGSKKVGLALTDEMNRIAFPYKTIQRKNLYAELENIVQEYNIKGIVLGYPLNMDGSEGEKAQESKSTAEEIEAKTKISVHLIDERWTSVQAKRIIHSAKKKPSKNKEEIDEIAAAIILEAFLEKRKH